MVLGFYTEYTQKYTFQTRTHTIHIHIQYTTEYDMKDCTTAYKSPDPGKLHSITTFPFYKLTPSSRDTHCPHSLEQYVVIVFPFHDPGLNLQRDGN